jgi:cytochrome c biogenesis protein CcmG, thiol:disulfide interchange protein DsbE
MSTTENTQASRQTRPARPARKLAIGVAIVVAAFIALLATRSPQNANRPSTMLIGKVAPEIEGPSIIDGSPISLTKLRSQNKYVLVNFFGSYCVPCIKEHPELVNIEKNMASELTILGVTFEENTKDAQDFFKKRGGTWPVVDQPRTAVDYGVPRIPESFLISPQGIVLYKATGGITEASVREILNEAKAGS